MNEMATKVQELKELQQMADELNREIETIKDEIKAEMTARGTEEMSAGMFTIRYTTVKSSRFDSKAFKKEYQGLYEAFTKESVTRRFSIA